MIFLAADRMKYEEFGFLDKDVVNIDKVIDSMHELVCAYNSNMRFIFCFGNKIMF